jgi:hypothetical protein
MTRQYRFQLVYGRLEKHKDFMVAFYGKKKAKGKNKVAKALKRIFNRSRTEDFKKICE